MFAQKYKPTIQKSLFHKDIVNHIRKWIKMLESNNEYNISLKQILFLQGPIGCAKSVTVECLFKAFNLIDIDLDILSSSEKTNDVLNSIVDFNLVTLENTFNKKQNKKNIVLIDNIELCEKGLENFIESIHSLHNIPIILICNNLKYKNVFFDYKNCTFIEFKKPSLLELNKLLIDINKDEKLNLTKENMLELIEKSLYDIRQLFFLIEQWRLSRGSFSSFIEGVDLKHEDQDLIQKMSYLLDYNKPFDFDKSFSISMSEPQVLSCSIYQNYNFIDTLPSKESESKESVILLNRYSNILDSIAESSVLHNQIYENQSWDLYNEYTVLSTVIPSYYFKQNRDILDKDDMKKMSIVSFKDFSYNFINSYGEVKKICKTNLYSKKLESTNHSAFNCISDVNSCFKIVKILVQCINKLNEYFENNKKGKNTTKKEKLDLCNNISENYKKYFDKIISFVYNYRLFEIDIDTIDFKKYENDNLIRNDSKKVDLRVLKRFLNIFTLDDCHKNFKSHIEISLQYKIFLLILDQLKNQSIENKSKIHETMTVELSDIWNF